MKSPRLNSLSLPARFTPDVEREFGRAYFKAILPSLRVVSLLLALLFLAYAFRDFADTSSLNLALRQNGSPAFLFLTLFGLSFWRGFERFWQVLTLTVGILVAALSLGAIATFFANGPKSPDSSLGTPFPGQHLFFALQTCILMVCFGTLRLRFGFALALQSGVLVAAFWAFSTQLMTHDSQTQMASAISRVLQPTLLIAFVVSLAAWMQEQLARNAFAANQHLARLQALEYEKRLESERTLHLLAGAIGGIVHDLGNPLTSVQSGASMLQFLLENGKSDPETTLEMARIIGDGAQMLDFLRLSLIEETRVLEGAPVAIERAQVSLRGVVEDGAKFQKPVLAQAHTLTIGDGDALVWGDEKRLVTVWMNLIGNAYKYSDGAVAIHWREEGQWVVAAVLDGGQSGRGLGFDQAGRLFVAFGRLETHEKIEGIGLGLVSVQKVIEAHGGEIWVEGTRDGTAQSPLFSTARGAFAPLLSDELKNAGFRTAFALCLPRVN